MRLTIITVVWNDLKGLEETIRSVGNIHHEGIDYWVIDGSPNDAIKMYLERLACDWVNWISEPDDGIYDAMNKGLERATGDFVLFLNAGDVLADSFSWSAMQESLNSCCKEVILGRTIETYQSDRYLRPGIGFENLAPRIPAHQATFYPRVFYKNERFVRDRPVGADGEYTARAISKVGWKFVDQVVSEFALGGVSSSYQSIKVLAIRMSEAGTMRGRTKLVAKALLWLLVPRRAFYRLLAIGKYTKL